MRGLAKKPRAAAAVIAVIGAVLIMVNHQTVLKERNYYPMLMLFGPVCVLYGITGTLAPQILRQSGSQSGNQTAAARLIVIAVVVIGLGIGWAMAHFWYRIW